MLTVERAREAAVRIERWWLAGRQGDAVRCALCGWSGPRFARRARCPVCRSLPRNRLVAYALERFDLEVEGAVVLHVAANVGERRFIEDLRPRVHVRADLTMTSAFNLVTDVTDLAVASASVDLAFAWHVLEHIPDDRAAIAEVTRVIRPGGAFLMSVPIHPRENPVTIDDPSLSPAAREATFGHPDHVRNCGLDYGGRLTDAGLAVAFVAVADVDDSATDGLGLSRNHVVWCGRRPGSVREPAVGAIPT